MDAQDVLALGLGVTPPWRLVEQRLDTNRPETLRCSKPSARLWRRSKNIPSAFSNVERQSTATPAWKPRMEAMNGCSGRQGKSQRLPQHRDLHHHDLLDRSPARRYGKIHLIRRRASNYRLRVFNRGKVAARNVRLIDLDSDNSVLLAADTQRKFPVPILEQHQSVDVIAAVTTSSVPRAHIKLQWDDESGKEHEKELTPTI